MRPVSIGDLATSFVNRMSNKNIKAEISKLTAELSTGRVQDVRSRIGGDFAQLADIERHLKHLDAYDLAAAETDVHLRHVQSTLSKLGSDLTDLNATLATTLQSPSPNARTHAGQQARTYLDGATQLLNGAAAGRQLFSGTSSHTAAVGSTDDLMTALRAEVLNAIGTHDIVRAVQDWFADPAGFDTIHYTGGPDTVSATTIAQGKSVETGPTARDPAIKSLLQSLALAALASDPVLNLPDDVQTGLLQAAFEATGAAKPQLIDVQADLGFAEARLEEGRAQNTAMRTSYELARNSLLQADPFETAVMLEEAQFQLESLYALTARSSQLSLLNYL